MLFWFFFHSSCVLRLSKMYHSQVSYLRKKTEKKNQNCVIFRLLELIQDRSIEFTRACRSSHLASLKLVLSLRHPEFRISRIILLIFSSFRPIQTWHHDCLDYVPPTIVEKKDFFPRILQLDDLLRFTPQICPVRRFPRPSRSIHFIFAWTTLSARGIIRPRDQASLGSPLQSFVLPRANTMCLCAWFVFRSQE